MKDYDAAKIAPVTMWRQPLRDRFPLRFLGCLEVTSNRADGLTFDIAEV